MLRFLLLICAVASVVADRRSRVVRGTNARPHEFPQMIYTRYDLGRGQFGHFCGATLLNSRTVLTAAHCSVPGGRRLQVVAGAHVRSQISSTRGVQTAWVTRSIPHPKYNYPKDPYVKYDFRILKLDRDIRESATVKFVKLPESHEASTFPDGGARCTLIGWGLLAANKGAANTLQKGPMRVKSHKPNAIQFFTNPDGPNKSSGCEGDSGGPLLCPGRGGLVQAGVATGIYSPHCGNPDKPMVFATVGPVLDWIRGNM